MTDLAGELGKAVLTATASEAVKRIVRSLRSSGSEAKPNPALVESRLATYAEEISRVRTLLSVDNRVKIDVFFCPPKVRHGSKSFIPDDSSKFKEDHVLVEGIAGQGKSILLRYLCANSISRHGRIALYYELRRLDKLKSLETVLREDLRNFGFPVKEQDLRQLSASRDLEIYLDGFDEIDQKAAEQIDRDLARLQRLYPLLRVFVSARPHAGLEKSDVLSPFRIEKLDHSDIERLIDKLSIDPALADGLKIKLKAHSGRAIDLLETPLLVTLLVAQYSQTQQVPEQLSEFYDNVFPLLFERHDSFKVPFQRKRRLAITNGNYRQIFQAFCFASLCVTPIENSIAIDIAAWAARDVGLDVDPAAFLADVSEISALILNESGTWSFIHNSIQEFFAAQYLLSKQDEDLAKCADFLGSLPNQHAVEQVLFFARELSSVRVSRFIDIPRYQSLLSPLDQGLEISEDDAIAWLVTHVRTIEFDHNFVDGGKYYSVWFKEDLPPIRCFAVQSDIPKLQELLGLLPVPDLIAELCTWPAGTRLKREALIRIAPMIDGLRKASEIVDSSNAGVVRAREFLDGLLSRGIALKE